MVALKGAAIDAFLARPDSARPIALVFGPDAGLVAERARRLIELSVDDVNDPFTLVRLDGDTLAADPARLLDETSTVPLFGGRRGILIRAGTRDFAAAIEKVAGQLMPGCRVVIEAGDLKRGTALRALAERSPALVALPCYGDTERELVRLIEAEMRAADLTIGEEARAALIPLLGADRRTSMSELRKLALYAAGRARVELDDVLAIVADASTLALERIVDAAFAGRPAEVDLQFARARAAGVAAGRVLSAVLHQAGQLHRARIDVEAGALLADATDRVVGKTQFRRRAAVEAGLQLWTAARLEAALAELAGTALQTRRLSGPAAALGDAMVARALLALATAARRKR
jgi:DNA polymerase-3 subunit delta